MAVRQIRKPIRNILILRYGLIGDSLYSFPIFPVLRESYPDARIVIVVDPALTGLLEACPHVDEIITFDRKGAERSWRRQLDWLLKRRAEKYDLIIALNASFQAALFAYFIGARERWGFDSEKRGFLLTHSFIPDPDAPQLIKYRQLLETAGLSVAELPPVVWPGVKAREEFGRLWKELKVDPLRPLVVFHTGASLPHKIWDPGKFAATADYLGEKGCQLIFIGGPGDAEPSAKIIAVMHHPAVNLAGKMSLAVLAELYARTNLAINNDSGPMHLAAFMGTPVIGLFGTPDYPACWRPWGHDVTVLYPLAKVSSEQVIECAAEKLGLEKR